MRFQTPVSGILYSHLGKDDSCAYQKLTGQGE